MTTLTAIGRPVGRIEGPEKVSGRSRFAADFTPPGTVWIKCLRSPHPHARIISIDAAEALRVPGVRTVLTSADLPDRRTGRAILDYPLLARERVRFVGERIAAVAADSAEIAAQAADLIRVEYEPLPAVFDAVEALTPGAPLVHEHPEQYAINFDPSRLHGTTVFPSPNVTSRVYQKRGDVESAFARAYRVFEHTFRIPAVHQAYLEPHACLVQIEPGGKINVWASNKVPFFAREGLSQLIGVPEEQIRVHLVPVGGDFGAKGSHADQALAYYVAKRTGRPAKMVATYTEELMAANPRHDAVITLKTGVTESGQLVAHQARMVFNNGAYAAFRRQYTLPGAENFATCYRIPNIEREILLVYTNTVPRGHMRTPGGVQLVFAVESHIDMMAHELGIDPLEFRLRNVLQEGDANSQGKQWRDLLGRETLLSAARAAGWDTPKPRHTGRGLVLFDRGPRPRESDARVAIDADGRVTLYTGVPECGVGAHTVLQQIVAEAMEVPLSMVDIVASDTDTVPYDGGVGASRVTHSAGGAAVAAIRLLRNDLARLAAELLECTAEDVRYEHGIIYGKGGEPHSLESLMARAAARGRAPLEATASYDMNEPLLRTAFCAQVAEVEVDPETGQVTVKRIVTANDVGRVLNPLGLQGQIEGGAIQGLGQTLMEHLVIEEGRVQTLHLGDYKLPSIADIPAFETVLLEGGEGELPFQGKHISEQTNVPTPAAIANAVFDAVGVRVTELPITPEKVYRGMHKHGVGANRAQGGHIGPPLPGVPPPHRA